MTTTITKLPLPTLQSHQIRELRLSESPIRHSAYNMILQAEQHAIHQQIDENIISARVVGYFLLEFHSQSNILGDQPCSSIVRWITSPPQSASGDVNGLIFDTGKLLRDKFIRLFRTANTPYPIPSSHPSRPSFDTLEDMMKDSMEATEKDYRTSRKKALARDRYRCMITGMLDEPSVVKCAELQAIAKYDDANEVTVQTTHILNESTMQGIDPAETREGLVKNKTHYAAGAMAILEILGFSHFVSAFKQSGGVHQVWNLLSLEHNLHKKFDALNLWFEGTDQPGRYKVCVYNKKDEAFIRRNFVGPKPHVDGAPMAVEFASNTEEAPHPLLLCLHATCARVAHMSGAAKFLDRLQWDAEETRVLAFDGSSAPLLDNLLSPFAVIPGVA